MDMEEVEMKLEVLGEVGKAKWGHGTVPIVEVMCYCGTIFTTKLYYIKYGKKRSCGCLRREVCAETGRRNKTHGMGNNKTRTYSTWRSMRERCTNSKDKDYPRYGAKGIKVCDRWGDFMLFQQDMGERPKNKTIDRIDNSLGYEPSNCRWATAKEQSTNRSNTRLLKKGDEVMCIDDWRKKLGVHWRVVKRDWDNGLYEEVTI